MYVPSGTMNFGAMYPVGCLVSGEALQVVLGTEFEPANNILCRKYVVRID